VVSIYKQPYEEPFYKKSLVTRLKNIVPKRGVEKKIDKHIKLWFDNRHNHLPEDIFVKHYYAKTVITSELNVVEMDSDHSDFEGQASERSVPKVWYRGLSLIQIESETLRWRRREEERKKDTIFYDNFR
jgi:hypothetical protein